MKWSEPIRLPASPRRVRARVMRQLADWDALLRWRDATSLARGVVVGEQRLSEQLVAQRAALRELHDGVIQSLRQAVEQVRRDSETALVTLAFEIAQKVVAEVPLSREVVEANVRAAMAEGEEGTEFTVLLHPDDLRLLQEHSSEVLGPDALGRTLIFRGSNDVGRGGCLVQTRFGVVDARRETRMERLREAVEP